jgi:hypothetical protein
VELPKRQLVLALAGLLVFLVGLNETVAVATRQSVPRRLMAHARQSTGASVIALGTSLIGTGFVESAFDEGMGLVPQSGAVNLGLGASSPVEQLLMLRYALHQGIRPQIVVYGFYDFQLTHPAELTTQDLIGNRAMLYYVEPEYARNFYSLSLHDRIEFEIMRHFELFADRGTVWERVERFRRAISQKGMPPEKTNAMGRANDFALLEFPSTAAFIQECGRASRRDLIPAVREIALQSAAAGSEVYFVEMPMPPAHVHSFYDAPAWADYRAHVRGLLGQLGVTYIDASHWMPEESAFDDPLHLTYMGAQQFSRRLGEYLRTIAQTP